MYIDDYFVIRKFNLDWVVERVTETQFFVVTIAKGNVIDTHGMTDKQVEIILNA